MTHACGQLKKRTKSAVDKARSEGEAYGYNELDEDSEHKMIYKLTSDRDENSKDVKGGTFVKDGRGKLVREQETGL